MKGRGGFLVAGLMIALGALWTLQGLDVVGGSPMSGSETWAVIGPLVAGLGVALLIVLVQNRKGR